MEGYNQIHIRESYITRGKSKPPKNDSVNDKKDCLKKIASVLKKSEETRTPEEKHLLNEYADLVQQITTRRERILIYKERVVEKEDPMTVLEKKILQLAGIISQAKHLICYTGAGISTSARIPDYRGTNGIWTLLQKGENIGQHDLSLANPTYTHMALFELHRRKLLRHVVSQNCDGLHLRSGLPAKSLSEIHGNMYIEVCSICKPNAVYWRLFDTTEITARYSHKTNRRCYVCESPLIDTIVHFGEKGTVHSPLNWIGAGRNAENADVILCLGSSLKVLKKYTWLWQMDRATKNRAKICIVNLQWTPKDNISTVKINGKCDHIMKSLMKCLNIHVPSYEKSRDPIFAHATKLLEGELHTVSQPQLREANDLIKAETVENVRLAKKTQLSGGQIEQHLNHSPLIQNSCSVKNTMPVGNLSRKRQENFLIDNDIFCNIDMDDICKEQTSKLPFWFDVSYAYSGLHSIVCPPPPGINLWSCQIVPIFQMNRKAAACEFCFDNYAEIDCQFYKKWSYETRLKKFVKEMAILCECCDKSRNKESNTTQSLSQKKLMRIQGGWYGKGYKKNQNKKRKL